MFKAHTPAGAIAGALRSQADGWGREYEEPAADGPLFHWKKHRALSAHGASRRIPTWTSCPKLPGGRQPLGRDWRERSQQTRLVVELVLCS